MAVVSEKLNGIHANETVKFIISSDCVVTIFGDLSSGSVSGIKYQSRIHINGTIVMTTTTDKEKVYINISGIALKKGDTIELFGVGHLRIQGVTL